MTPPHGVTFDSARAGIGPGAAIERVVAFDAAEGPLRLPGVEGPSMIVLFGAGARIAVGEAVHAPGGAGLAMLVPGARLRQVRIGAPCSGALLSIDVAEAERMLSVELGVVPRRQMIDEATPLDDPRIVDGTRTMLGILSGETIGKGALFTASARVVLGLTATALTRRAYWVLEPRDQSRFRRVEAFVERNLARRIRLEDLATEAAMSGSGFSRWWSERVGGTPLDFVARKRLDAARAHLLDGLPIGEAAAKAGFSDQPHLTRRFKAAFGATPRAWLTGQRARGGPGRGDGAAGA